MSNKSKFYVDIMCLSKEVTGSCHLCIVKMPNGDTVKFIVDCGLFQEKEFAKYNSTFPFNPEQLAFALVTHNHTDHIGRLPLLAKLGFRNKIYATELTKVFMKESLDGSARILGQIAKRNNVQPLFDDSDVETTLPLIKGLPYSKEIQVHENISVTFLDNGHLPGAALICVKISYPGQEDINILFTGDYTSQNVFFDVSDIPQYILDLPLTIIQESTYATTYSNTVKETFEENILKAVAEKKTIIITVYSLGRAQEIALKLKLMQDSGKLSKEIPISLDGKSAIRYTNIFIKNCDMFKEEARDFLPGNFTFATKDTRKNSLTNTDCKIILTSSGMGSYGPAPDYITKYISSENALIHFVGYPAEGTLSRKLKDAAHGDFVKIGGVMKQKKCNIEYTTEFSAHAKLDQMLDFLKKFNNIKLLLINHGEYECKENLAKQAILHDLSKDVAIESRSTFYRIGTWGLIKELTTKFL